MPRFVDEKEGILVSVRSKEIGLTQLKTAGSGLAQQILALLAEQPRYSHEIAKRLKVHEQKIYYHVRKLEQAGLIEQERREEVSGATAKYYRLAAPSFTVLLTEPEPTTRITAKKPSHEAFLTPFINDGQAEFLIVIGSPDAHGPQMARAKDGGYAIDLALFLGSFLEEQPPLVVKLDTEFKEEDWRRNLIVIGGPIVNTVAARINEKLPIRFKEDGKTFLSTVTKQEYDSDEIGIIVKANNPFARGKKILFIAGRRGAGTKAAIIAFRKHFDEIVASAKRDNTVARVVEGRDLDSDGIVDAVKFRE